MDLSSFGILANNCKIISGWYTNETSTQIQLDMFRGVSIWETHMWQFENHVGWGGNYSEKEKMDAIWKCVILTLHFVHIYTTGTCVYMCKMWSFYDQVGGKKTTDHNDEWRCQTATTTHAWQTFHDCSLALMTNDPVIVWIT